MLEWMSVQHLIWASPKFPPKKQRKNVFPSGLSGNGILVITGSPIHHWITPALLQERSWHFSTYHGSGTSSWCSLKILSFRPFDPSQKCSEWVNHSEICPVSSGLRPFQTEAQDWWWYSGFCQGSPKVFVPVSSETLHCDAKSTDFRYKGEKKPCHRKSVQVKHPLHWIISRSTTFQWRCFSNHSPVPRFRIIFCFFFRPQGGLAFFRVSFGDTTPGIGGSIFSMVLQIESWRPNGVLEKSYQNTTPPEVYPPGN